MKRIVITFEDDGTATLEGEGFEGRACDAAMAPYEEELGGAVKKTYKAEAAARTRSVKREAER